MIVIVLLILVIGGIVGVNLDKRNKFIKRMSLSEYYNKENDSLYYKYRNSFTEEKTLSGYVVMVNNGIAEHEYSKELIDILLIEDVNVDINKIDEYVELVKEYPSIGSEDVVHIINEGLKEYTEMPYFGEFIKYENFDYTKMAVYDDLAKNTSLKYNLIPMIVEEGLTEYVKEGIYDQVIEDKFFMLSRAERYYQYMKKNPGKNARDVVAAVNCNCDYQYYTNVIDTDLSKGYLVINNKYNVLSRDYVPSNLVTVDEKYSDVGARLEKKAYEAFVKMCDAAEEDGFLIVIKGDNGYRSYNYQAVLYNMYASWYGVDGADECSARPGYSEHQTGLAVDTLVKDGGKGTYNFNDQYRWLMDHCWEYGFIERYEAGKEFYTGYQEEQWHYRYVGEEVSKQIRELGITFDEYYAFYVLGE